MIESIFGLIQAAVVFLLVWHVVSLQKRVDKLEKCITPGRIEFDMSGMKEPLQQCIEEDIIPVVMGMVATKMEFDRSLKELVEEADG